MANYGSVLSPSRVLAHDSAARLAGPATTTYFYDDAGRKASETAITYGSAATARRAAAESGRARHVSRVNFSGQFRVRLGANSTVAGRWTGSDSPPLSFDAPDVRVW